MARPALSTTAYTRGGRIAPSAFFFEMAPANIACPRSKSFHEIIAIRIHFTSLKGFKAKITGPVEVCVSFIAYRELMRMSQI
jgi:hypothetical protein